MFFKVAEAVEGHPQIFGLFDRNTEVGQPTTTLDHFAFGIDLEDLEPERRRLEEAGVQVSSKEFPHFKWRSIFFYDPEGNTIEFVAYDPSCP